MLPSGIGFTEILVVSVVAVLLFGSKLPEVAKNLGKSYQQFRKGLSDLQANLRMDESTVDHHQRANTLNRASFYKDALDQETPLEDATPSFTVPPPPPSSTDANP